MASYPIPNLDEQHRRILSLRGAIMPEADVSPGGSFYRDDRVIAAAVTDTHAHLDAVDRDASPLTAEGNALDRWGELRAVTRKGATTSKRSQALEVRGTNGTNVSSGLVLIERRTGLTIQTISTETIASGSALVDVQSIATGEVVNFPAGTVFDFSSPPAGVNQQAKLVLSMQGGLDAESDGQYRDRIVNRFQQPPQGGNSNDYVQWALEATGVDAAYALPERAGVGTVDVVALRDGSGPDRLLSAGERDEVFDYIEERRPIGASVRVLEVTTDTIGLEVLVTPLDDQRYRFDWDDTAPVEVLSYDSATRTVTTVDTLPDSFIAGVRFVIDHAFDDAPTHLVQAITSTTTFVVALDPEVTFAASASDLIYAAGPLTEAIRSAILDGFEMADGSRAPGINQLGPANEESKYGPWIDTVERGRITAAANSVPGVYRVEVPVISLNGETIIGDIARPDDPAVLGSLPSETTTIGLLISGRVLVRPA